MCKNVVLVPLKQSVDSTMQKSCKLAMLGRIWQACRRAVALEHTPGHHFAVSQWQKGHRPSNLYLLYRWSLFITLTSIGVTSFACQRLPKSYKGPLTEINFLKWFIYFTNWGYLMLILESALALAVVLKFRNEKTYNIPCEEEELPMPRRLSTPLLCRAYWLLHNIATDLALVITLVYWIKIHNPEIHELDATNVLVHGVNSVVVVIEIAVTAHPVRFAHAVYGAGAGLAYGVFSAVYWAAGGTDRVGQTAVYPVLDWNKPGSAFGFVALCAVVMVLAHAFATLLAMARARLARRICQPDCHSLPTLRPL